MRKKKNITKANKTAGQVAAELEAKKLEDATKLIEAEQKRKLAEATIKFKELLTVFENSTGYTIAPLTVCFGKTVMESSIKVVKIPS